MKNYNALLILLLSAPSLFTRIQNLFHDVLDVIWRFLEIHVSKLVFLLLIVIAAAGVSCLLLGAIFCFQPSAVYFPLVLFVSIALCLPSAMGECVGLLVCIYLSAVGIAKMVYQVCMRSKIPATCFELNFFGETFLDDLFSNRTCTNFSVNATERHFMKWAGFRKNAIVSNDLAVSIFFSRVHFQVLIVALCLLAAQSVIVYRQRLKRRAQGLVYSALVFPNFDPKRLDESLLDCIRFFIDYGFYKFGLEVLPLLLNKSVRSQCR